MNLSYWLTVGSFSFLTTKTTETAIICPTTTSTKDDPSSKYVERFLSFTNSSHVLVFVPFDESQD
jgi:hypothetical protein